MVLLAEPECRIQRKANIFPLAPKVGIWFDAVVSSPGDALLLQDHLQTSEYATAQVGSLPTGITVTSAQVKAYLRYIALFMAFFIPVFIGGGLIGGMTDQRVSLHLDVEDSFPFLPEAVWAYLSLYTIFVLPLIHLSVDDMTRLGHQSVFIILLSGPFYIFLPALNSYPQPDVTGLQGLVIDTIRRVDILHNLVPSLHIAFAWLILLEARRKVGVGLGLVYLGWAGLVTIATVLLHRHYLIDLASGFALALLARRLFPFRPQATADAQ